MEHLFKHWGAFAILMSGRVPALFMDYDGTLTPIVRHPSLAKLSVERKNFLKTLSHHEDIKVTIVSGRSLSEIAQIVGIPEFIYAGNHGLEFKSPKIYFVHPAASAVKKIMKDVAQKLEPSLESYPGIFIENKGLTLSVHYRELSEEQANEAKEIFSKTLKPYIASNKLITSGGKKVWEVRPKTRWNKGTLVLWLLGRILVRAKKPVLPIYIGDDETDEDAFKALKGKGIGIKVTEHPRSASAASYFLHSPSEVYEFLKKILELKRNQSYAAARIS